jgi:hypothetical protein
VTRMAIIRPSATGRVSSTATGTGTSTAPAGGPR